MNPTTNLSASPFTSYYKQYGIAFGDVGAAIVFQQLIYRAKQMGGRFYKFVEPCDHEDYREGDSWTEELGMTKYQVSRCLDLVCFKRGAKSTSAIEDLIGSKNKKLVSEKRKEIESRSLFIRYIDSDRKTFYMMNTDAVDKFTNLCFSVNQETSLTREGKILNLLLTRSEITTEITTEMGSVENENLNLDQSQFKEKAKSASQLRREIAEEIYEIYPKKAAPLRSVLSIEKALKKIDRESLLEAVQAYAKAVSMWRTEKLEFVPNPDTWFNEERWREDRALWYRNVPSEKSARVTETGEIDFGLSKKGQY